MPPSGGFVTMITLNRTSIMAGIGLLLVGLLTGILAMLVLDSEQPSQMRPAIVEPVNLDAQMSRTVATDTSNRIPIPDLNRLNQLFRDVSLKAAPAVVSVQSSASPEGWLEKFEDEGAARRFFQEHPPHLSVGSGVIVNEEGFVVTNHHVIRNGSRIRVTLRDKREFEAELIGADPTTDLALLKIQGQQLPVLPLGNSQEVQVGEWVLAIGNPFRLNSTVTAGIVSALGRQVNIIESESRIEDFIQTDAAINPGNSGGALVNLQGELVGINTAIATESGSYEGYGFAIPVNLVKPVVNDLRSYGEVRRGYLGIVIDRIDATAARELGLENIRGVYVASVTDGGAAEQAGLREGDVILAINDQSVNAPNTLQRLVASHEPGTWLQVRVWRGGRTMVTEAKLLSGDSPIYKDWLQSLRRPEPSRDESLPVPPDSPEVFNLKEWGIGLSSLSGDLRDAFEVEDGVYLAYVERGSEADAAGLPRNVVLQRVNDQPVNSVESALAQMEKAAQSGAALLQVRRSSGSTAYYEVLAP